MPEVLPALAAATNGPGAATVADAGEKTALSTVRQDARALAHLLRTPQDPTAADAPVVLALPRSRALISAYLGAFLAGVTFVPVDPGQPAERIAHIVRDSGARRVVTFDAAPAWARDCQVINPSAYLDSAEDHAVDTPIDGERPAYIVYTSGSTGTPKGVLVPQRGLEALLHWNLTAHPLGPDDCVSITASPGFDASVWEHFVALAAGVSFHVPTDEERIMPARLQAAWRTHRVTQAFVAPQIAQKLFELDWDTHRDSLRRLFCGGDALRTRLPQGSPVTVVNAYGPSECSVVATAGVVAPRTPENQDVHPDIGTPLPEIHPLILDDERNPVRTGARGTLWVGGPQVALGYVNNPQETAARFVDGAEIGVHGTRFYCTGDLVSEKPDGRLVFHGRADGQVKIDGVRIEVGEVEAVLARHPEVLQAYVRPVEHPLSGVTRLCATVSVSGGIDRTQLRRWAQEHLPRHMVPISFIIRDTLPLTLNGKVNGARIEREHRDALLAIADRARDGAAPADGGADAECARAVSAVLGYEVGAGTPLASTGMTSLMAADVAGRLSAATGRDVPPRVVLGAATLGDLAAAVAACDLAGDRAPVERLDVRQWAPATPVERSMWFLWQRNPSSPEYNIGITWIFDGALDAERVEEAVRGVLVARPELRLTFRQSATGALSKRALDLNSGDPLGSWYETRTAPGVEAALELATAWHVQPFDLAGGPLARFRLVAAGADSGSGAGAGAGSSVLQVVLHHSIADGLSIGLLAEMLRERYDAAAPGLPTPAVEDGPGGIQQARTATVGTPTGEGARQIARIGRRPRVALGTPGADGGLVKEYTSGGGLGVQVRRVAAERRTSVYRVLLAMWLLELRPLLGVDEITIGVPMHGRVHWQLRSAIGNYANVVPVVLTVTPRDSFDEVLASVESELDIAETRMNLPFAQVARAAGSRRPDATDIVDVTFGEQLDLTLRLGTATGRPVEMATDQALFGISAAFRADEEIVGRVEARRSAVTENAVDALVGRFFDRLSSDGEKAATAAVSVGSTAQLPPEHAPAAEPTPAPTAPQVDVAAVWREVLGLQDVQPDDDFFELGGDSLRAQMVVTRLREAGVRFTIEDFFMNPYLREQQKLVDDLR